ncbi:MAG: helix-turn-helix domain-containing protein [Oscillospiraceae bacterium]|nr:helix-turn-helix domain-containing protein [Oscillospiraceae bacterium]
MTIGQRIYRAREEAGLSQRQAAGEHMTRNMLSFLEHDKAKPSLDTLVYLSKTLGKPLGYFLGEDGPQVPGWESLREARRQYDAGAWRQCLKELSGVPEGEVLGRECSMLRLLATLSLAEQAASDGRLPYARELSAQAQTMACPYPTPELTRRIAILAARTGAGADRIPEDDALSLKAEQALSEGRFADARRYLEALDLRDVQWYCRMGDALFGQQEYRRAAECFHTVEQTMPKAVRRKLQLCYAALKDFEQAYRYATMED